MKRLSANERLSAILKLLNIHHEISNQSLANLLKVSAKTIRCDIKELEIEGLVKRVHGGVIKSDTFKVDQYSLDSALMSLVMNSDSLNNRAHEKDSTGVNKMNKAVFVLGSFNVDIVANVARFPYPGETLQSTNSSYGAGGKGANQAFAAAQNGANVTFLTKIGKDQFNYYAKDHLGKTGISNNIILESEKLPTGNALIYVSEQNGENMIAVGSGANTSFSADEISDVKGYIATADLFLTQLETNIDAVKLAMEIANENGVKVLLNPAPYHKELPALLPFVDILTPNETEASEITGITVDSLDEAKHAAVLIHTMGVKSVVITRGSKGALIYENGQFTEVDSFKCVVADTTGAGDAFNGALVAELVKGNTLPGAAKYASAYASLAVERTGAANMPEGRLVKQRLEQAI